MEAASFATSRRSLDERMLVPPMWVLGVSVFQACLDGVPVPVVRRVVDHASRLLGQWMDVPREAPTADAHRLARLDIAVTSKGGAEGHRAAHGRHRRRVTWEGLVRLAYSHRGARCLGLRETPTELPRKVSVSQQNDRL